MCQPRWRRGGVDGLEVLECYGAFLFEKGGRDVYVQGDNQIVGDREVSAGQVIDGDARGADQVQCVSFSMGIYVLGNIEIVSSVQVFYGLCSQ